MKRKPFNTSKKSVTAIARHVINVNHPGPVQIDRRAILEGLKGLIIVFSWVFSRSFLIREGSTLPVVTLEQELGNKGQVARLTKSKNLLLICYDQ